MDVTELDRALESTLAILTKVQPADLDAPTPCASWDVRALINHFTGTARWWAGVVAGEAGDTDADYADGDVVAAYEESIGIARAAFEADGALERTVRLPFGEFPGVVVRGMAALDQFTHGWDLARAIGYPTDLDPELAEQLLGQARMAITDELRGPDGEAPFGTARQAPAGAGSANQLAAFLGRPV
jgi:uncharacterized protein (TIGR03086 family)